MSHRGPLGAGETSGTAADSAVRPMCAHLVRTCEAVVMRVMCCFCGQEVSPEATLTLGVSRPGGDETQGLTCHAKCLDQRLHPSVPRLHET